MRIFFAGDYISGTGPANVTKYYIDNLPEGTLYQKRRNKVLRAIEIMIDTIRADAVVYSGYSMQNILGMKAAKLFGRPCAYLMHGCVEYENEINREPDPKMAQAERDMIRLSDAVYAVSPVFCRWLKEYYPDSADKFDYVPNGVDIKLEATDGVNRNPHMIFSVGGGMPRKKIAVICKAVEILRREYDKDMFLVIAGDEGDDSREIDSYTFVDNRGLVDFEENVKLMKSAAVFVQNSCFETFGLAPIEAVLCGCSTLVSKEVGALCILGEVSPDDLIYNCEDEYEIADKIKKLIDKPNASRLVQGINRESNSWKRRSQMLLEKLSKLV